MFNPRFTSIPFANVPGTLSHVVPFHNIPNDPTAGAVGFAVLSAKAVAAGNSVSIAPEIEIVPSTVMEPPPSSTVIELPPSWILTAEAPAALFIVTSPISTPELAASVLPEISTLSVAKTKSRISRLVAWTVTVGIVKTSTCISVPDTAPAIVSILVLILEVSASIVVRSASIPSTCPIIVA